MVNFNALVAATILTPISVFSSVATFSRSLSLEPNGNPNYPSCWCYAEPPIIATVDLRPAIRMRLGDREMGEADPGMC
jgi:hypothetical protein